MLKKITKILKAIKCELTSCCGCTMKCNQPVEEESTEPKK